MLIKAATNWNLNIKHFFYETYLFIIFHIRKNLLTWDLLMLLLWSSAAICVLAPILFIWKNVLFGRSEIFWHRILLADSIGLFGHMLKISNWRFIKIILTNFSWAAEPISSHCFFCDCSVLSSGWSRFL